MAGGSRVLNATIVITSLCPELLKLCRLFIPGDVDILVVDGRNGMYGMRAIAHAIEHTPSDRAILLDEDAFILNFSRLRNLAGLAEANESGCIGMPDGGIVTLRQHNPNAMNPFFNIIDLRQVRSIWNPADVRSHQGDGRKMTTLWPHPELLNPGIPYEFDDFEPYYCFYFWLQARGLRLDWLSGVTHSDGVSTILNDPSGEPFLMHTWYGRRFGRDERHTSRIIEAALWASANRSSD